VLVVERWILARLCNQAVKLKLLENGNYVGMRRVAYIGVLAVAAFATGFLITLWYIDTRPPMDIRSPIEQLAEKRVSNYPELHRWADTLGLPISRRMKGFIEGINRINNREVSISGWLADPEGYGAPLDILVFVDGLLVARTQPQGERADVTHHLGLAFGAEKNTHFRADFPCRPGVLPVVVGLGAGKQYFPLPAHTCP
jgi:hypothetical protein